MATCLKTCGLGEMIKSLISYMAWLGMCAARKDAVTVLRLALGVSACCLDGFEAGIRTSNADWKDKLGCADVVAKELGYGSLAWLRGPHMTGHSEPRGPFAAAIHLLPRGCSKSTGD